MSGKQIRRDIGRQLGALRRYKKLSLQKVSEATKININTIDEIEMGIIRPWECYTKLRNYYNCDIKLVEK
ncbi:MAG: hypothetical protein IJ660_01335 [Alphaproteobacteria bacterium]|nr:hypothetical protein [Alphaproteobacteria bacterium]